MSPIGVNWNPDARQLRTFGLVAAVVSVVLAALTVWRGSTLGVTLEPLTVQRVAYGLTAVAAISALLSWTVPRALKPLYVLLTAISLPIGFVVSYLVLGFLFYVVLTPFGLVFRLFGRDPLARRFDASASTYWVRRSQVNESDRYYRLY